MPRDDTIEDILKDVVEDVRSSQLHAAHARSVEALAMARQLGNVALAARAGAQLAKVLQVQGLFPESIVAANEAMLAARASGNSTAQAQAGGVIARVLLGVGDTNAALTEGLAALSAARASHDQQALTDALSVLCSIYAELNEWYQSGVFADRMVDIATRSGDVELQAQAAASKAYLLALSGHCMRSQGDLMGCQQATVEAIRHGRRAILLARRCRNRVRMLYAVGNLAEALITLKRFGRALLLLDAAGLDESSDPPAQAAQFHDARGAALAGMGRLEEALPILERSVESAPDKVYKLGSLVSLAEALEQVGDLRGALNAHKRLAVLTEELSSEKARCSAAVAAVRLGTARAEERAASLQERAHTLEKSNAQLRRRSDDLTLLANADPLTGLPNRRRLDELLRSSASNFSIVMIDVDHFKRVNDDYSHAVGDAVLQQLALLLRKRCRQEDTPIRLGGEEFALWLQATTLSSAVVAAERARRLIESHRWSNLALDLQITASFGVAHSSEAIGSIKLLAIADARMYAAKRSGRNRVVGTGSLPK